MKWKPSRTTALALGALAAGLAVSRLRDCGRQTGTPSEPEPLQSRQAPGTTRPQPAAPRTPSTPLSSKPDSFSRISALIADGLDELRDCRDPGEAGRIITRLRESIRSEADEDATAAAIAAFLRNGADAPTGQPFIVGPDGMMAAVPSLRTALLDLLPSLDPDAALDIARSIIRQRQSPDEYALALRNVAWNDHNGDLAGELTQALDRMLDHPGWLEQPSAGFLEAFDVALQVPSPALFKRISGIAQSRPLDRDDPLLHAACMTLDRMILRRPELLSNAWSQDPGWLENAPEQRASLMSRLDLGREDHRALLLDYLASPRTTAAEREGFVALFPNGNYLHGHRLVSAQEPTPSIAQRQEMDRQTLAQIESLSQAAPETARPALDEIRRRLAAYAGSHPGP